MVACGTQRQSVHAVHRSTWAHCQLCDCEMALMERPAGSFGPQSCAGALREPLPAPSLLIGAARTVWGGDVGGCPHGKCSCLTLAGQGAWMSSQREGCLQSVALLPGICIQADNAHSRCSTGVAAALDLLAKLSLALPHCRSSNVAAAPSILPL